MPIYDEPGMMKPRCERSVRLDHKFTADFGIFGGTFSVKWNPDIPAGRERRKLLPAYLRARDDFLEEVASQSGQVIAVAALDGTLRIFGENRS